MKLLEVNELKTYFYTLEGVVKAVDGVSFKLDEQETLGLVGESGCGKSTVALSLIRLVPTPGRIVDGQILFEGKDLLKLSENEMRQVRGAKISIIFQNPLNSLNPVYTIEDQIGEAIRIHQDVKKKDIGKNVAKILEKVGIPDPEKRMKDYPHLYSGGMRQRAMISMAISCNPNILIADEPTTNLDVTIQAQIMELMKQLKKTLKSSIILITHDMGLIAEICENVAVMYAGKVVEYADVLSLFDEPSHPYTEALLSSIPGYEEDIVRFKVIKGSIPNLINPPPGCRFHPRCRYATNICEKKDPPGVKVGKKHISFCFHIDKLRG